MGGYLAQMSAAAGELSVLLTMVYKVMECIAALSMKALYYRNNDSIITWYSM